MIPVEKIFPTILILLDVCAAGAYAWKKDMWLMTYWLAAGVLTACVTYKP